MSLPKAAIKQEENQPQQFGMTQGQIQAQLARQQSLVAQQQQQQLRAKARLAGYKFATTTQEILTKYAKFEPSLEFHIYENHYRFNNIEDSIIPKNNTMIKNFLKDIINENLPPEMCEVLRDGNIKFYEGCVILQVYDHRNSTVFKEESKDDVENGSSSKDSPEKPNYYQQPKSYRTLLRPSQLSLYYDLLHQTDSALTRFTDQLALSMEMEILTLTQRNLDLSVPLNPYKCDDYIKPESKYPYYDEETETMKHVHREEGRKDWADFDVNGFKKLHEDLPHRSSEYEQLMTILNPHQANNSDLSTGNKMDDSTATTTAGKFLRLRFIESFHRKKAQMANSGTTSIGNSLAGSSSSIPPAPNASNLNPINKSKIMMNRQQAEQQQQDKLNAEALARMQNMEASQKQQQHIQEPPTKKMKSSIHNSVAGKTLPGQYNQHQNLSGKTVPGMNGGLNGQTTSTSGTGTGKKRGSYKKKVKSEQ